MQWLTARYAVDYHIELSPAGRYIVENCIPSGGVALLQWYKQHFGQVELDAAAATGRNVWEVIYDQIAAMPVGNQGMMVVPYWQGANGPYWDLNARGLIFGMTMDCGRAHLLRGLIEGLAYEARREAELMVAGAQTTIRRVKMYGGSARSTHWNQIFADVLNTPLDVPHTAETTALGAAINAAVGCGMYASFAAVMTRISATYLPIPAHVARYDQLYRAVYVQLYDRLQDLNVHI
jgi:sugar (pentulose or hexulose) kinase